MITVPLTKKNKKSEKRVGKFWNMDGNIPGGNFLGGLIGWNFSGGGFCWCQFDSFNEFTFNSRQNNLKVILKAFKHILTCSKWTMETLEKKFEICSK